MLDNRELASLIWLCVLAVYLLAGRSRGGLRSSLLAVIKAFFHRRHIPFWLLAMLWVLGSVWLLSTVGIWQWSSVKTTIIWAFGFAFLTLFRLDKVTDTSVFLRETLIGIVSVTALVEFIAEAYTLPLLAELVLVPIATTMAAVQALTEDRDDQAAANKVASSTLIIIGSLYLIYATVRAITEWDSFASVETVGEFFVPILLSLTYVPFMLATCIYMAHERARDAFRIGINPEGLGQYARWQALLRFRSDLDGLRRFQRNAMTHRPQTRADVRALIREIKTLQAREGHPPYVATADGWCPYAACKFLEHEGIETGDYHRYYDEIWGASSGYKTIGEARILGDHVAYYVDGSEHAATQLKLILDVNHAEQATTSDSTFFALCEQLLNAAGYGLLDGGLAALSASDDLDIRVEDIRIRLSKEPFGNNNAGYSRCFTIERASHS